MHRSCTARSHTAHWHHGTTRTADRSPYAVGDTRFSSFWSPYCCTWVLKGSIYASISSSKIVSFLQARDICVKVEPPIYTEVTCESSHLHVSHTALLSETPSRGSRQPLGAGILSGILKSSRENTWNSLIRSTSCDTCVVDARERGIKLSTVCSVQKRHTLIALYAPKD